MTETETGSNDEGDPGQFPFDEAEVLRAIDALETTTDALEGTTKALRDERTTRRWQVGLLALFIGMMSVVSIQGFVLSRSFEESSRSFEAGAREARIESCERTNDSRQALRLSFRVLADITFRDDPTPQQQVVEDEFLDRINTQFPNMDCDRIAEGGDDG